MSKNLQSLTLIMRLKIAIVATISALAVMAAFYLASRLHLSVQPLVIFGTPFFLFAWLAYRMHETRAKLSAAMDKSLRLQDITAAFSMALTPDEVYDIIFKQAFESLQAMAGTISLLTEDKNFIEIKKMKGFTEEIFKKWQRYSIMSDVPTARVVRFGHPLFIKHSELKDFKDVKEIEVLSTIHTIACLPLIINSEVIGVLSLSFDQDRVFSCEDKDFIIALSRHCAWAIHRSELYEKAQKAIDVRDEFLSMASHELRTPLTPLKLQVQSLGRLMKKDQDEQRVQLQLENFIETSNRQINRLSNLIDNLLDVTLLSSGHLVLSRDHCSLKDIVANVLWHNETYLHLTKAAVHLEVERDSVGYWDKEKIEQVLLNLITNAAKHAPHKPVHIVVTNDIHTAKIFVKDEGPGIEPENLERIFGRFERVVSRENIGGLGLGLYISKQIVEAHNGKIYVVESSSAGSLFTVELPREKCV